jgi:hypothetical protein
VLERVDGLSCERKSLQTVARVQVHLSAARLGLNKIDLVTETLKHRDDRATGVGIENVVHTGDEQGYAHDTP